MNLVHPTPTDPAPHWPAQIADCLGYAEIIHRAYAGDDLSELSRALIDRISGPVVDTGALLDLSTVLQLQGGQLAAEGRLMQANALAMQRSFGITHGAGKGPRVLALVTAGNFMANTPIDFLLRGSDAVLILHFIDAHSGLGDLPEHDVAFMAIGESPENAQLLAAMPEILKGFDGPIFNASADVIAGLSRDRVAKLLAQEPSIYAPPTYRLSREDLIACAMGGGLQVMGFPMILRPIGSHAGAGMSLISNRRALVDWLRHETEVEVYAAPFVDYRGANGLFTKARVVQILGRPFASHLASSTHWMVHYLNADMTQNPERRAAEAAWMAGFDQDFARRHAAAFEALYRALGLDYFGIDCAEMPDGRLLVFEVDVAMIVHDMDDEGVFPYKKPVMRKLFAGFVEALAGAKRVN